MKGMRWKEASTVIIAAKSKSNEKFHVLSLQRSEKSSFLPNVHVFPGGLCDEADSSLEWLKVFKLNFQNLVNLERIEFNMVNPVQNNSNVYKLRYNNYTSNTNYVTIEDLKQKPWTEINQENKILPKFISLRITAIREAFEECGILLCRPNQAANSSNQTKDSTSSNKDASSSTSENEDEHHISSSYLRNHFHFEDLSSWRKRVYNNPMEFVNLCLLLDCHPDLNNVRVWSNWLSPGNQYFTPRYDSKFFLVMFNDDEMPKCDIDYCEMKSLQWCTPEQLIKDSMEGKIWLPPPQFYECSRLLNFQTLSELNTFLNNHDSRVCEQWLPVRIKAKDGEIALLPGDSMYPVNDIDIKSTDYYKDYSDLSMTQLQQDQIDSKLPIHRMQYSGPFKIELIVKNYCPTFHSIPLSQSRSLYGFTDYKSKL